MALGRPLLADPDLPRKMAEGREDEIMACGSCLQGCLAQVKGGGPIGCIVNPEVGREAGVVSPAVALGERLVVVGGGPAGMEAALIGVGVRGTRSPCSRATVGSGGSSPWRPSVPARRPWSGRCAR